MSYEKGWNDKRLRRGVEVLSQEVGERYQLIVGESVRMKQAVDLARKTAASNATVLLLGESGTGKEIFARSIHNWSDRTDRPFIAINSVALSKELLESELFGYEPGAFTGAQRRKKGKVELAQGGTIFFDEIGDISQDLQAKLLRFLQEREFERVGGTTSIAVDVRVIAATSRDLERAVREGTFREDLYHRLNVVPSSCRRCESGEKIYRYRASIFCASRQRPSEKISPHSPTKPASGWLPIVGQATSENLPM